MKKTFFKSLLLTLIAVMLLGAVTFVKADDTNLSLNRTTGTITINRIVDGAGVEGITFDIYKVGDEETSKALPTDADVIATKQSAVTDADGKVTFTDLALGRYLIVESEGKEGVTNKVVNILVDLPTTEPGETVDTLNYDLNITPKTFTSYGAVVLKNIGITASGRENIEGSEFKLQVKNGTTWEDVSANTTLTTAADGTITVEGLKEGEYRFTHVSVPNNYILDNKTVYGFTVKSLADGTTEVSVNGTTLAEGENITVYSEKPGLTKEITDNLVSESVIIGQDINYKLTVDLIPTTIERLNTFTITDTFPTGLDYDTTSLVVSGTKIVVPNDAEPSTFDTTKYTANYDETTKKLTITFDKNYLVAFSDLTIEYKTKVNQDAPANETGMKNTATLEYSLIVDKDYDDLTNTETAETLTKDVTIYTGGFWIKKVAEKEDGNPLAGATFRIAASEQDAKDGNYLTDANGNVIEITSDATGKASYKGLELGTYWLVEVKAPTYQDDDGETKSYNLLRAPQEIEVSKTSYESTTPAKVIINKTGFQLPTTGGPGTFILILLGLVLVIIGVKTMKGGPKRRARR